MNEFDRIDRFFKPLATHKGALGLSDDIALLSPSDGCELVITTDAIAQGVHFIGDEPPASIAKKLLRTNLSDLAAKGAKPLGYQLCIMLPTRVSDEWLADFARGLAEDQQAFGISLLGGDSTRSKGLMSFAITAIGEISRGKAILRSGAKPDELIVMSGTLGDSSAGLKQIFTPSDAISAVEKAFLMERYRIPTPRLSVGQALIGVASAAMDISDGLMQDLGHLCRSSGCGAAITFEHIPLSTSAKKLYLAGALSIEEIVAGGDDYELLFTVQISANDSLQSISGTSGVPLTVIGKTTREHAVYLEHRGAPVHLTRLGYNHF